MMNRSLLIEQLEQYNSPFGDEMVFIKEFLSLLGSDDCYKRSRLDGHVTSSAWITDRMRQHVLLLHHRKLDRWLQPGGHADGDEDLIRVSRKEVLEETGIENLEMVLPGIFDVDIHVIPERKDIPEHKHYDIRYWFYADSNVPLQINHESNDVKWVNLKDVMLLSKGNNSILRMIQKTKSA